MRIIGGQFKGRRFNPPADKWPTRPTTDYAKEGLFNILQNRIDFEETRALDLFGGTGSHDYELISRGCRDVTYVDRHGPAVKFVRQTAEKLNITDHLTIFKMDVFQFIDRKPASNFDYIFAGPPYPLVRIPELPDLILGSGLLKADGLFVLEHNPQHDFSRDERCEEVRTYGTTHFAFFR
ncbi:MAG: RsmD family RNA methyltransferase [Bacteroidota bacterium]